MYFFLLDNLNLHLTLQCVIHIKDIFHRLAKRNMFVLAFNSSSHAKSTPHVGSTVKKQGERLSPMREIKMSFIEPSWQILYGVSRGILRKILSLTVAASWVPPGHCDPTVTVSGGVRIQSSWEDFRRAHRAVRKARYIFNIDCEKENTKSKNNKCYLVFTYV